MSAEMFRDGVKAGKAYEFLAVVGAIVVAFCAWFWLQRIVIPHQNEDAIRLDSPRGNLSDLYPRWLGSRELLLHHRDPYSKEITREIQMGYYGRLLDPSRPNDPPDQQAFAYPVYVAFLLAPTVKLPYDEVKQGFFWFLAGCTALSVLLWMQSVGWTVSAPSTLVWIVLTLGSLPVIQGLKLQQLSLLVAGLVAASMCALASGQFVLAGILLSVGTIKPHLVALPMAVFGIWALGGWRERRRFIWSVGLTMVLLFAGGERLLRGWVTEFRQALNEYWKYTGGGRSVLDFLLTPPVGRLVSGVLVGVLIYFAWQLRRSPLNSKSVDWLLALTMSTTVEVVPMVAPYNQVLLLPAVMVLIRDRRVIWQSNRAVRFTMALATVAFFWPWVGATGSVAALLFLNGPVVQKAWWVPWYTTFVIPTLIVGLLLLAGKTIRNTAR